MEPCGGDEVAALSCGARDDGAAPHAASAANDIRETIVTRRFIVCASMVRAFLHVAFRLTAAAYRSLRYDCTPSPKAGDCRGFLTVARLCTPSPKGGRLERGTGCSVSASFAPFRVA